MPPLVAESVHNPLVLPVKGVVSWESCRCEDGVVLPLRALVVV